MRIGGKVALLIGAGFIVTPASAQAIDDKYWFQLSGFRPNVDSDVTIGRPGQPGTELDFEEDLDLEDRDTLPAVAAGIRLGRRWRIGGDYYSLSRSGTTTLTRNITVDDVTYPAMATIDSRFDTDIYRLTVGYSFVRNENVEVGAAIGAHVTEFVVALEGMGSIGGQTATTQVRRRTLTAPLPTVGLYGAWEIANGLTLRGRADYLSLKIDEYKGELLNFEASLAYRVIRNVGVGIMWRRVSYRLDVERDNWDGKIGYQFSGPGLFLEAGF